MLRQNNEAIKRVAALTKEEIAAKLSALPEYSTRPLDVSKMPYGNKVVGALNNEDTEGSLALLVQLNPTGVVAGLAAFAKLCDTKTVEIVLPKISYVLEDRLTAAGQEAGVSVIVTEGSMIDVRAHHDDLLIHLATAASLADLLVGEEPKLVLSINDDALTEVSANTLWKEILPEEPLKAICINHRFYPAALLEQPITVEQLRGGAAIKTIGADCCMVQKVHQEIKALRKKSCGKCTFCREGLMQLDRMLDDVEVGRTRPNDIDLMREIGEAMTFLGNCSLGDEASAPVLSLLDSFQEELLAHINKKVCPAGACLAFTHFYIDPALCRGDGACAAACPANAIETKNGYVSTVDEFECTKCGKCLAACANGAVKQSASMPKLPAKPPRIKGAKVERKDPTEKSTRTNRSSARKRSSVRIIPFNQTAAETAAQNTAVKETYKIMKTMTTDVIVVAGGPAGLAAAITVGERGLKSIIFEKSSTTGGAANMGMGPLGIDTKIQKEGFNNISVEDALKLHMRYTHYRVDEDLVQTYFNKSAETIDWLMDMGVEFAGAFRYFKESEATWHIVKPENGVIGPRAASGMVKIMTNRAKELGSEIFLETPVQELIVEDDRVVGVIAVDKEGNTIEARAKAVVVCTGGFGNNKEMIQQEFGLTLGQDFFPFMVPGITGDGLRMMWKAGAAKYGANIEAIYQVPDNLSWFLLDAVLRQPNLLINQLGDRFMNEGEMGNTTFTGNALALQPGNYAYCIMDEAILKFYKKNGPDIFDIVHPVDAFLAVDEEFKRAEEQQYPAFVSADTVEELAEKLGIDADKLQDTIDEYNEMCETGVDTKFHKDQKYLHPIYGKGKYLVGKFYLAAYGTIGGVRINKYCEVLDDNFCPIEGLYSAGSDANTIYGDSYNFTLPGNTMGFAVNSGRMAGDSIADYIESL